MVLELQEDFVANDEFKNYLRGLGNGSTFQISESLHEPFESNHLPNIRLPLSLNERSVSFKTFDVNFSARIISGDWPEFQLFFTQSYTSLESFQNP